MFDSIYLTISAQMKYWNVKWARVGFHRIMQTKLDWSTSSILFAWFNPNREMKIFFFYVLQVLWCNFHFLVWSSGGTLVHLAQVLWPSIWCDANERDRCSDVSCMICLQYQKCVQTTAEAKTTSEQWNHLSYALCKGAINKYTGRRPAII